MKSMKQALAMLLCFLMLFSTPVNALATGTVSDGDVVVDTIDTETCSFNSAVPLTTDTPTEEPTKPTVTPTLATEPAISTELVGCSECAQTEGHLETCSQYMIPASVVCSLCGQSDGHAVGCLATFTEVAKTATFIEYPVTLYYNPVTEPDNCKSFDESEFGENFTFTVQYSFPGTAGVAWYVLDTENWGIFADTDAPYSYIQSDYVTFDPDTEDKTEQTLTDEGSGVCVSGYLPEGTSLSVEDASLDEIAGIDSSLAGISEQHIGMDISLLRNGTEYQPAESVTVTMNVSNVASVGEDVLVYHVHENEDGTVEPEILGPFQVDEDGNVAFAMSRFSNVLVFNANYEISGVEAFYPGTLEGSDSTNDQFTFLGVYYDENNIAHFLLAFAANSNATNAESKFEHVTIDTTTYYKANVTYSMTDAKFSNLTLKDENGNIVYTSPESDKKGYGGVFDITLGNIQVRDGFFFGVNNNNTGNGWRIGGNLVLDLDYELIKTVAAGTSATGSFGETVTVNRGDWVIFKINVNNKGARPLTDMLVQDILPENVFDISTVQMSIDGVDGEIGNWEPFNSTLFSNYDSEGNFSRLLYIKAQVDPELSVMTDTTYTNKATIDGMNMPTYEDTASVIVKAPTTGTLTVSKAVTSENPNDPAPDTTFTFTIHSDAENAGPFNYKKSDGTTGSVADNGTFTLENGDSIEFSDFPVGKFTVTETDTTGFTTKVNGNAGTAYTGNMIALAAPVVAFENQYSTRMATLTITKTVEQDYINDVPDIPADGFAFTIVFGDGSDTTTAYPYTIGETTGTITSGGTIKLGDGQTAEISDIPVGTAYTVTENLGDLSDDYTTTVNGANGDTANGTMQLNGNTVTIVNTYTQHFTDLTITKTGAQTNLDENQSFIFDVVGPNGFKITVTINGNNSVTIKNVPFGQYTVTENTDWSWRYTPTDKSKTITLVAKGENEVTFTNNRSWIYWLSGDSYCENWWGGSNGTKVEKREEHP